MTGWLMRLTLIVAALLTLSNGVFAQIKESGELNLFGGVSAYTKNLYEIGFPQSPTPIPGRFRLDTGLRAGLRFNAYTRGHWGEEFLYSYEPNSAQFVLQRTPSNPLKLDIQVHNVAVNTLYYLQEQETQRIRPFLTVGLGASIFRPTSHSQAVVSDPLRGNAQDLDTATELALNYGLGFKTRLSSWIGFRMDARGFVSRNPSFGLARQSSDPNATVFPATGAIHHGEATGGLIFYFSKR